MIRYAFDIHNSGTVTLSDIRIVDQKLGLDITLDRSLAPGENYRYVVEQPYTVTAEDIVHASVDNQVSVHGKTPDGKSVDDSDDVTVSYNPPMNPRPVALPVTGSRGEPFLPVLHMAPLVMAVIFSSSLIRRRTHA